MEKEEAQNQLVSQLKGEIQQLEKYKQEYWANVIDIDEVKNNKDISSKNQSQETIIL